MRQPVEPHEYFGFFPPYRRVEVLRHPGEIPTSAIPNRGAALVWNLSKGDWGRGFRAVRERPPGVALLLLLPPAREMEGTDKLLRLMQHCRPHSILPHHEELDTEELRSVLRRFPTEFALEVVEYLAWRGVEVELDTRRLLRKTMELSENLRTVAGLARSLYMSRRALGRRFMSRGLPVPSHWLHFGRVLRACLHLQRSQDSLFSVACDLGYPDGFALSNQMRRLTGLRPSMLRDCFGWEWIVEAWLFQEARNGGLSPSLGRALFPGLGTDLSQEVPSLQDRERAAPAPARVAEEGRLFASHPSLQGP